MELLFEVVGAPWRSVNGYNASIAANSSMAAVRQGLCFKSAAILLSDAPVTLEKMAARRDELFLPGVDLLFRCFLSLRDAYIELTRVLYIPLFLSFDFVPIVLLIYPFRRYDGLEKAMGVNLDKLTCYVLPLIALYIMLFIITIEFQLSD